MADFSDWLKLGIQTAVGVGSSALGNAISEKGAHNDSYSWGEAFLDGLSSYMVDGGGIEFVTDSVFGGIDLAFGSSASNGLSDYKSTSVKPVSGAGGVSPVSGGAIAGVSAGAAAGVTSAGVFPVFAARGLSASDFWLKYNYVTASCWLGLSSDVAVKYASVSVIDSK